MNKTKKGIGRILVHSVLNSIYGEPLSGMKINLYLINGVMPHLKKSLITGENGICEFKNVEEGSYRIIEVVDKNIYNKPKYYKWNDINIYKDDNNSEIYIINSIRN